MRDAILMRQFFGSDHMRPVSVRPFYGIKHDHRPFCTRHRTVEMAPVVSKLLQERKKYDIIIAAAFVLVQKRREEEKDMHVCMYVYFTTHRYHIKE